jgi:DNA-binding MarR family transcriptional regulator
VLNQKTVEDLGAELVTRASRLVRALRRDLEIPASARVLSTLDEQAGLTITQLAAAYPCSQPTMSGLVSQLEESGWVTRSPHPTDTRASVLGLSPAGADELARVRRLNGEALAARLAAHPTLTTEQLETAVAVLDQLLAVRTEEDPK